MKRRDVMKVGAVAAGAGLGVPGCAVPRLLETLRGDDGAAAFNAMLDQQLAAIGGGGFVEHLAAPATPPSPAVAAMIAEKDALFRKMLRSLLVTQGFRDLPPETQLEPAVQARMWSHMDEVGSTVFEVGELLANLDDHQRAHIQRTLRERPELPMELGAAIDTQAEHAGISRRRRTQLRQMMSQATFRLRHGDPGALIDEYVEKVERVRARGARDAGAIDAAQQLGERAFWRYQHLLAAQPTAGAPAVPPSTAPGNAPVATPDPAVAPAPGHYPGQRGVHAGAYMMGIGVITFGVSALLLDAADGFVVGMTVGALLFSIGLIVLIVSAIIYSSSTHPA